MTIIDTISALHGQATQGEWYSGEQHETKCNLCAGRGTIASFTGRWCDPSLYANVACIVALHNSWPAIERVLRMADDWEHDRADSHFGLVDAVRALRALESK